MQPHIRWMIRKDMPEVQHIENLCFEFPWSRTNFMDSLRTRNVIGMVAVDDQHDRVLGYMIYEFHKNRLHVLNFAVDPLWRRHGIGTAMIEKLRSKLNSCLLNRRNRIMLEVRETNVAAQLFFKSQGFRAISVLRDFYEDTSEDAYLMMYRVNELSEIGQ
jgi:[ribosomal protein S18]-alanine N-acetyltransferase